MHVPHIVAAVSLGAFGILGAACIGSDLMDSDESTGEATDEASEQDTPVALPYHADFKISKTQLLIGHPFHVNAGAMVSIVLDATWTGGCHAPYHVALREEGIVDTMLQGYLYPSGTIHTEHWKVPRAGDYRMVINLDSKACLPFHGHAVITSP